MINRGAVILKYKEPAVIWINEADPVVDDPKITIADANRENTVYLITNEDCDGDQAVNRWVRKNFEILFESELEGWYSDPTLWPENRTYKMFQAWFDVENHSVLVDTVGDEIYDDEI